VVGINEGCKELNLLLGGTKGYSATGKFGVKTDTQDAEGQEIGSAPFDHITEEELNRCLNTKFLGKIMQIPPMYFLIDHLKSLFFIFNLFN